MISKLNQLRNVGLMLGLALLIIVLSALFGFRSFETGRGVCTSAWRPMELLSVKGPPLPDDGWTPLGGGKPEVRYSLVDGLRKTIRCDLAASSRRYTIYFVAATTFSILGGGVLVFERLRKKV